ncbi:interferon lambda-4-like [Ursus americanus]|uniref:interferon lambda-4-like n=1 Tax=Ursus americanus TaxID=9643 RepID=UPI001E67D04C|nr:interferon lambda-4-like [Ursus americanus]
MEGAGTAVEGGHHRGASGRQVPLPHQGGTDGTPQRSRERREADEMGLTGAAAVAVALWVLVTAGEAADPGVATPRSCLLSHYRSLDPKALAAVKALRDRYEEETLSWRLRNCSLRPRKDPPLPWSCARLRFVVRSLADAQAVLSRLPSPERFPGTGPTLELLAAARRDVGACLELVRPGFWRKSLRPPRRRSQTRRADSPRCHEASVIFSLLRLLTWDLKLVASSGPCL